MPKRVSFLFLVFVLVLLIGCDFENIFSSSKSEENQEDSETPTASSPTGTQGGYKIVDTDQQKAYNNTSEIDKPTSGQPFYGQDANYLSNAPSYTKNGNGTITDNITGLMWQASPNTDNDNDIDSDDKKSFTDATGGAKTLNLAGYTDWRLPTIKELYSLIMFSGEDVSPTATNTSGNKPFINTDFFDFAYGDIAAGERIIDAQFVSATEYVSTTMNGDATVFGVNFADGRIKGYPKTMRGSAKMFYVLYVRGNENYGKNSLKNNDDNTISDEATGLMWQKVDNGQAIDWSSALAYCESLSLAGHGDWRLPNAKELQSIVDYNRSPATTTSAAIDPLFDCSSITNEAGKTDFPNYWTSTTHANGQGGTNAVYISFGRAMGKMNGTYMDVHGAGSQRSDPKSGNSSDYPKTFGPQGDVQRVFNYVRAVRNLAR